MTEPLLDIRHLDVVFHTPRGTVAAVQDVSLSIDAGEVLGLVGESGSGKSVTTRAILQLNPMPPGEVRGGEIRYRGQDLLRISPRELQQIRGAQISMIFQDPMSALNPVVRVGDQIAEALTVHGLCAPKQARERAVELLRLVGLPAPEKRARQFPHNLSGGMRQRVVIAIALACSPKLILADEPTTALDVTVQDQILKLLLNLKEQTGAGLLLVTHDLAVVAQTCDRVAVMYAGRIVETGPTADVLMHPRHPYTRGLLASVPAVDRSGERLQTIPGALPDLTNPPPGCLFAPRCARAEARCTQAGDFSLAPVAPEHATACLLEKVSYGN
jgi:oligopeptide/dipeptide ABC transporter ATP-binding protein